MESQARNLFLGGLCPRVVVCIIAAALFSGCHFNDRKAFYSFRPKRLVIVLPGGLVGEKRMGLCRHTRRLHYLYCPEDGVITSLPLQFSSVVCGQIVGRRLPKSFRIFIILFVPRVRDCSGWKNESVARPLSSIREKPNQVGTMPRRIHCCGISGQTHLHS